MKSFKQFITEATMPRLKGWGHSKTGKLELIPIRGKYRPYHQEFAANNLRRLGLKEKDVIDAIESMYDTPTRKYAENIFNEILDGRLDRDNAFGDLLKKKGWYPIVLDDGMNSIGDTLVGSSPKKMHKIAKAVDKQYGAKMWDLGYEQVEVGGREIHNRYDWEQYLKTGRIGVKTEIGSTMAQFREEAGERRNILHEKQTA